MARIGTRKLKIEIDGDEYTAEVSKAVFTSGESDSDFVTFADAAAGGARDYALNLVIAQDAAAASLWSTIFGAAGTEVPVTLMPYGNAVASVGQPHFTATCVVKEPDGDFIGGEADVSTTAAMTVEVSWPCLAKPEKDTGA